jgi:hypothetical protein
MLESTKFYGTTGNLLRYPQLLIPQFEKCWHAAYSLNTFQQLCKTMRFDICWENSGPRTAMSLEIVSTLFRYDDVHETARKGTKKGEGISGCCLAPYSSGPIATFLAICNRAHSWSCTLQPWRRWQHVPPKSRYAPTSLHGGIVSSLLSWSLGITQFVACLYNGAFSWS